MLKVAIDTLGGDFGPKPIIEGVVRALKQKNFTPILVGDEAQIKALLSPENYASVKIVHCTDFIRMEDKASDALRHKESSIYKAVELVKDGQADAVVSAGHSGATMSLATLLIGRIKGISRPAIATFMPSIDHRKTLVLDVGANVDCNADHLFEFGVMGEVYTREHFQTNIKVGLLSNGEEEGKGNEIGKKAFEKLKALESFVGNIEASDLFKKDIDVVVCDGFTGNILLKSSEGAADSIVRMLKKHVMSSLTAKVGGLLMKKALKKLKKEIDYAEYGGAPLLGLKKCAIIAHGKSNTKAIKNAIFQSIEFGEMDISHKIEARLSNLQMTQT